MFNQTLLASDLSFSPLLLRSLPTFVYSFICCQNSLLVPVTPLIHYPHISLLIHERQKVPSLLLLTFLQQYICSSLSPSPAFTPVLAVAFPLPCTVDLLEPETLAPFPSRLFCCRPLKTPDILMAFHSPKAVCTCAVPQSHWIFPTCGPTTYEGPAPSSSSSSSGKCSYDVQGVMQLLLLPVSVPTTY